MAYELHLALGKERWNHSQYNHALTYWSTDGGVHVSGDGGTACASPATAARVRVSADVGDGGGVRVSGDGGRRRRARGREAEEEKKLSRVWGAGVCAGVRT